MKYNLSLPLIVIITIIILVMMNIYSSENENIVVGKVISVIDGDTIKILTDKSKELEIKLAEIEAPERDQPYGRTSKQNLSQLIYNRVVTVKYSSRDRYARIVGYVVLNNTDINLRLIKSGSVWVHDYYSLGKRGKIYKEQEAIAKNNKVGLWALQESQRVSPWHWRENKRRSKK